MLSKNKLLLMGLLSFFLSVGLFSSVVLFDRNEVRDYQLLAQQCFDNNEYTVERVNCWYGTFRLAFMEEGIEKAFEVFAYTFENFKDFSDTGCHRHGHRMGDIAYYSEFLKYGSLEKMEFPQNANACGYGFYHGFIEHLVQDNPTPVFAEEQCRYLTGRLTETSPGIEGVCYHASGHGFLLAQADELQDPEEWTITNFTTKPLQKCDELTTKNSFLKHECRQGVFNVFVDWMETGEYGFVYDGLEPYTNCKTIEDESYRHACYIEMTRKIEIAANFDPVEQLKIIQTGEWSELESSLLTIAVAGIVMHDPYGTQEFLTEQCRVLPESFQMTCFKAVVHGLFEHGIPDAEYKLADAFCASSFLYETERKECYDFIAVKLERFRNKNELEHMCSEGELSEKSCSALET